MRWTVTENSDVWCPGLSIDDLPDKMPPNIHVMKNNGKISILSENVAGILPCKNGNEIIIQSKYNAINPIELLLYINGISSITVNRYRIQVGKANVSLQTIADAFVDQLLLIKSNSKKFRRIPQTNESEAFIGHIDWLRTMRKQNSGNFNKVVSTVYTASYDIPENNIIAAAAQKVIQLYKPGDEAFDVLYIWTKIAERYHHSYNDLFKCQQRLNERTLSGAHAFYYPSIMLAKMILGFTQAGIQEEENNTILFNMPGLYEEYIRTGFQRTGSKYGYSILKGFIPRSFLFFSGECEIIPDITVYKGSSVKALLDVKYKTPDSKDYYQIFTYMKYAKLDNAFIVSPSVEHEKTITAYDGSKITLLNVDSSSPDLLSSVTDDFLSNKLA